MQRRITTVVDDSLFIQLTKEAVDKSKTISGYTKGILDNRSAILDNDRVKTMAKTLADKNKQLKDLEEKLKKNIPIDQLKEIGDLNTKIKDMSLTLTHYNVRIEKLTNERDFWKHDAEKFHKVLLKHKIIEEPEEELIPDEEELELMPDDE